MMKYLFIILMSLFVIGCTNKENNIQGVWEHIPQYQHQSHIVYSFSSSKYRMVVNGVKQETPLPYKIEGDTVIMDLGEYFGATVGKEYRYSKKAYSISKGSEGATLMLGDLLFKKVK